MKRTESHSCLINSFGFEMRVDKRILIVDDDLPNTQMLKRILEKYDFLSLQTAHTGAQALNILGISITSHDAMLHTLTSSVDMVLLDVVLPDMNGFEVCDQIKKILVRLFP